VIKNKIKYTFCMSLKQTMQRVVSFHFLFDTERPAVTCNHTVFSMLLHICFIRHYVTPHDIVPTCDVLRAIIIV
jgi:hypothetical protein